MGYSDLMAYFSALIGVGQQSKQMKGIACLMFKARWWRVSLMVLRRVNPIMHTDEGILGIALYVWTNSKRWYQRKSESLLGSCLPADTFMGLTTMASMVEYGYPQH